MNYLYCTFWIFGRYMHHGSATAGGLCLLFNGSHKMHCIQSPCKDGEWENSFCRIMAELLNYLFNWDGGKKISSWLWKSIYGSVWKFSGQKNSCGVFFALAVEKKKSLISQCTNYFTECCSVCNCFSISATSMPTPCGLISVASWQCVTLSV